jgi:hypothetical protein
VWAYTRADLEVGILRAVGLYLWDVAAAGPSL